VRADESNSQIVSSRAYACGRFSGNSTSIPSRGKGEHFLTIGRTFLIPTVHLRAGSLRAWSQGSPLRKTLSGRGEATKAKEATEALLAGGADAFAFH
jgi:hypothetical protein